MPLQMAITVWSKQKLKPRSLIASRSDQNKVREEILPSHSPTTVTTIGEFLGHFGDIFKVLGTFFLKEIFRVYLD